MLGDEISRALPGAELLDPSAEPRRLRYNGSLCVAGRTAVSQPSMTYCVAMSLDAGMIFASDSRTNAGVDQIARFSQDAGLRAGGRPRHRHAVLGQPSITQNALNMLELQARGRRQPDAPVERRVDVRRRAPARRFAARGQDARRPLPCAEQHRRLRQLHRRRAGARRAAAPVQRLRRGQLHRGHARHVLFPDRRDQVRQADHRPRDQALDQPARGHQVHVPSRSTRPCARISRSACRSTFWSTRRIRCASKLQRRIEETDPYFQMVHTQWGEGLRRVFAQLPDPDWT